MLSRRQAAWAEIDRIQKLLRKMEDEASRLGINISDDKLYIALKAYISGLEAASKKA
nr:hypothetical protein 17 [bacterium]